jgi:uncharacterized protein (TIGR03000 family)
MVSKYSSIPLAGLALSGLFVVASASSAQVFQTTAVDGPNGRIFYTSPVSAAPGVPAFDPWAYGYPFSALASALNLYGGVPNPADLPSAYYYAGIPNQVTFPGRVPVSIATLTAPVPANAPPPPVAPPATRARVDVKVPRDATVWVQGQKSAQSGTMRHFITGDLEPGFAYTYRIKASWTENGHKLTVEQPVTVRAGGRESVTFVEGLAHAHAARGR